MVRQRRFDPAILFLTKALLRFRDNVAELAKLLDCRAKVYYHAGRFRKSLADYTLVLELKPEGHNLAQTLYGCGLALFQLAKQPLAEDRFAKALKLDPRFHRAKSALRWLAGKDKERPAEMNAPAKQPTSRPDVTRNPVDLQDSGDRWNAASPWDQWILYVQDDLEFGPVTKPTLDRWCAEGRIADSALLGRTDWEDWMTASEIYPELAENTKKNEATATETATSEGEASGRFLDKLDIESSQRDDEFPGIEV